MTKPKSQIQKFRETARKLEADQDENRFNETLRRVAKAPADGALRRKGEKPDKPGH